MSAREEAKIATIEEITEAAKEKDASGMASFAMAMHAMVSISKYEEHLDEKIGNIDELFNGLVEAGFTDVNGVSIADSLVFRNLKNRLT